MEILFGLLIIAVGSFCQSSSYVPIKKVREWSWESFWLTQGLFAWLLFPLLGALLAVPAGHSFGELLTADNAFRIWMTILFGALWGVGGLTFGLSMRYLGVALGQSISLGTCAGLGTILGPVMLQAAVKDFDFPKGIDIALLAGLMSACFNMGLEFGGTLHFAETGELFRTLPGTFFVTLGGFATNAVYCLWQNARNKTFGDYGRRELWANNLLFCALAGGLWYSQFFGLSLGKGFLAASPTLTTFAFCILMALNVTFSNVWGILLKEWKGCSRKTIAVLVIGIAVLIVSTFIPELLK